MLLRVSEVARRLHISPASVYQLIQKGTLPCHRVGPNGGAIRVSVEDLERFLTGCRHEKSGEPKVVASRVKLKHLRI